MRTEVKLHIDGDYRVFRGEKIGGIVPKHTSIDETSWVSYDSRIRTKNDNCLLVLRYGTRILNETRVNLDVKDLTILEGVQVKNGDVYLSSGTNSVITLSGVTILDGGLWLDGARGIHFTNSNITKGADFQVVGKNIVASGVSLQGEVTKLKVEPGGNSSILISNVQLKDTQTVKFDKPPYLTTGESFTLADIKEEGIKELTHYLIGDKIIKNKSLESIGKVSNL
jgi:hypothetical protein